MRGHRRWAGATQLKGAGRKLIHLICDRRASSKARAGRSVGLGDRPRSELAQDVEAAASELARVRQRGACVREAAPAQTQVVAVVGARLAGRRLRRLIKRPAQRRRPLLGDLADLAATVGAADADVEPGQSHRLARSAQTRDIAELGERHRRGDRADPELALECAAAGLAAREAAQLVVDRRRQALAGLHQLEADLDPLARGLGQLEARNPRACALALEAASQPPDSRGKERRPARLAPGGVLVGELLAQSGAGAKPADVVGWDPGLGQAALAQQRPKPARVLTIGLGPALAAPPGARLGDLGEMGDGPGALECTGDEIPAGARLEGDVDLFAREARDPLLDRLGSARDAAGYHLAALRIERIERDLGAMDVEAGVYDAHRGTSSGSRNGCRRRLLPPDLRAQRSLAERTEVPQFMPSMRNERPAPEQVIARIAARQHGVI